MGHLVFNIDVMLAKRKMSVTELSNKLGHAFKNGVGGFTPNPEINVEFILLLIPSPSSIFNL